VFLLPEYYLFRPAPGTGSFKSLDGGYGRGDGSNTHKPSSFAGLGIKPAVLINLPFSPWYDEIIFRQTEDDLHIRPWGRGDVNIVKDRLLSK
jgi:hypothetical protein